MTEVITRLLKRFFPNTIIIGEESSGYALVEKLVPVEDFAVLIPSEELIGIDGEKFHQNPIKPDIEIPGIANLDIGIFKLFFN